VQFRFQLLATRLKFLRLLFGGLARLPFGLFAGQQFGFYLRALFGLFLRPAFRLLGRQPGFFFVPLQLGLQRPPPLFGFAYLFFGQFAGYSFGFAAGLQLGFDLRAVLRFFLRATFRLFCRQPGFFLAPAQFFFELSPLFLGGGHFCFREFAGLALRLATGL
jgi:hypothetical protein